MRLGWLAAAAAVAGLVGLSSSARAGEVSFSASYALGIRPAGVELQLELRNGGNEEARGLRPFLDATELPGTSALAPGAGFKTGFHWKKSPCELPGHYVLPLDLRWKDLRGFEFVNTLVLEADCRSAAPPALAMAITPIDYPRAKEVVVKLANRSPSIRFSRVALRVASLQSAIRPELPPEAAAFELPPGGEREIRVAVSTSGKLVAGEYSNFLIASGDAGGLHFEAAAPVVVRFATEDPGMAAVFSRAHVTVAFWALLLGTVGFMVSGRQARRSRSAGP